METFVYGSTILLIELKHLSAYLFLYFLKFLPNRHYLLKKIIPNILYTEFKPLLGQTKPPQPL